MKANEISAALLSKGGFECLEEGGVTLLRGGAQLKLLGRAPNEKMWKPVRNRLQLAARRQRGNDEGSPTWTVDISRWYFLLEDTETEVFAWRVLLQGVNSSIEQHLPEISDHHLGGACGSGSGCDGVPHPQHQPPRPQHRWG